MEPDELKKGYESQGRFCGERGVGDELLKGEENPAEKGPSLLAFLFAMEFMFSTDFASCAATLLVSITELICIGLRIAVLQR